MGYVGQRSRHLQPCNQPLHTPPALNLQHELQPPAGLLLRNFTEAIIMEKTAITYPYYSDAFNLGSTRNPKPSVHIYIYI